MVEKRNRRVRPLVSAVAIAVATAALGGGASSAAAAAGQGGRLDALVVNRAGNGVLDAFLDRSNARVTRTRNARTRSARPYDLVVLDGDVLSAGEIARREELDRFADRGRWVLALDVGKRDQRRALEKETGFSALGANGGHTSDAFLFRRSLGGTSPLVTMLDARPLSKPPGDLNGKERRKVRQLHARNAAKEIESFVNADEAQPLAAGPGAGGGPPDELQSRQWEYIEHNSELTPPPFYWDWTIANHPPQQFERPDSRWVVPGPAVERQLASWTMTHTFGVYLDNGGGRPQGNNQIVTYDLKGRFSPQLRGQPFVRMFDTIAPVFCSSPDPFYKACGQPFGGLNMERAWWTGIVGNSVTPEPQTDSKLQVQASEPRTPNAETTYTSGQEFSVGFTASLGPEGPSIGFSNSHSVSNQESHTIPDWGVANQSAGNELAWRFSARHPCDPRPEYYNPKEHQYGGCFDADGRGGHTYVAHALPTLPNELSRGDLQVETSGRWKTKRLLAGADGTMRFTVDTPVTTVDIACYYYSRDTAADWCGKGGPFAIKLGGLEIARDATGPKPQVYEFDAASVIPIPIQSLTFSPSQANGTKNDTVTGTVTLEKDARMETSIVIYSDSKNAALGAPIAGGISRREITVTEGERKATFKTTTNDNTLSAGGHTTANITAFYAEPFTVPLRICAGDPPC